MPVSGTIPVRTSFNEEESDSEENGSEKISEHLLAIIPPAGSEASVRDR